MIFLTVGTQLPFDRLVRGVDEWCAANPGVEVFGQIHDPGPAGHRPRHFEWVASLDPESFQARFAAAEIVVAHAGMGSIITAMTLCKPLVIMARRAALGEQRNDHQQATIERFRDRPGIHAAADESELARVLDAVGGGGGAPAEPISPYASPTLIAAIRGIIGK